MAEHKITLLNGAVKLDLPDDPGLKPTTDAVFLASVCLARAGDRLLDLGCGVGTVALCVSARVPGVRITGVDCDAVLVECAHRNAAMNGVADATFLVGDVRVCPDRVAQPVFDHVVMNPPFYQGGTFVPPEDARRARALGHFGPEVSSPRRRGSRYVTELDPRLRGDDNTKPATLADWIMAARDLVKSKGTVTMMYHAESVDDVVAIAHRRFGGITIIPLWPHAGDVARRVIVRMVKDSQSPAVLHPGLVLHAPDGAWTEGAENILKNRITL